MLNISVRLFARFRERAGTDLLSIRLPDGSPVSALRDELARTWPDVAGLVARSAVAVNEEYVADDWILGPGDDVALIPPVSGGLG
jgi:molybdopterin converting factor subunit 1